MRASAGTRSPSSPATSWTSSAACRPCALFNRGEPQVGRTRKSASATGARRWRLSASPSSREPCWSSWPRSVSPSSQSRSASGSSAAGWRSRLALTVLVLSPELYLPLRNLAAQFHAGADGLAVASRLLDLVEAPSDIARGGGAGAAPAVKRPSGSRESPSPIRGGRDTCSTPSTSSCGPGETVALVGSSGAGKSTVASLLLLLAEPSSGRVTAGGVDLARMRPGDLAGETSPGFPSTRLSSTAPWRKTSARRPRRPRGAVRAAAGLAGADEFIRRLPDGFGTIVGDGGRALSAGERRRIAIARAFLRDAPLVPRRADCESRPGERGARRRGRRAASAVGPYC